MASGNEAVAWMERVIKGIKDGKDKVESAGQVAIMARWAAVACRLAGLMPPSVLDGVKITRFAVKPAVRSPGNLMLTIQGTRKKENLIAFHTGEPGAELFDGFMALAKKKGIKWQPDKPWEPEVKDVERESLPALPVS